MISILAFDSNCVRALLTEENENCFKEGFPIFYKNKHESADVHAKYSNALDVAIINN